jgi:chitin-binding protein
MNGARPANNVSHPGTVPSGRTGRHMILAVWTIHDTANAFYQCSDVRF